MLGADYPRVHDPAPVFSQQVRLKLSGVTSGILEQIEEVSRRRAVGRTGSPTGLFSSGRHPSLSELQAQPLHRHRPAGSDPGQPHLCRAGERAVALKRGTQILMI